MQQTPRAIKDKARQKLGEAKHLQSTEQNSVNAQRRLRARFGGAHGGEPVRSPDPRDEVRNQGTNIAEDELGMESSGIPTHIGTSRSNTDNKHETKKSILEEHNL